MDKQGNKINSDFCLEEFEDWLLKQDEQIPMDFNLEKIIENKNKQLQEDLSGFEVKAKVSREKIDEKIEVVDGDQEDLIEDLLEFGGTILEDKGKQFLIEVDSGSFYLSKFCLKIKR